MMELEFKSELKITLNVFLTTLLPSICPLNLHLLILCLRLCSECWEYSIELGHSLQCKRIIYECGEWS